VKVSIFSLIYQSSEWADFVYDSVHKYTPMLARGDAEFFFVANDATPEVIEHLKQKAYPYYVKNNIRQTEAELFKQGYGKPEYISRVYKGFNFGIEKARGEIVVIINSDMAFSPDWLENMVKYLTEKTVITAQLVERDHPKYGVFKGVYHGEFGSTMHDFREREFLGFALKKAATGLIPGKGYAPCAFYKATAEKVGGYPEGNIAGKSFDDVVEYGDERFFYKLAKLNIPHYTNLDSIVYHFKEGEMATAPSNNPTPRDIPQPDYFPLKPVVADGDKVRLNTEPQFMVSLKRDIRRAKKYYKRMKQKAGKFKNRVLGK